MGGRIAALLVKEFLALLKDRKSRFVIIGPPLIQMFIFGYAATYDLHDVPFAVWDEDGGAIARDLIASFRGSPNFREAATIRRDEEIEPVLDSRRALIVLHVGPRFSDHVLTGRPASLQLLLDGRDSNTALIALGYADTIVERFNETLARHLGTGAVGAGIDASGSTARIEVRHWFNPNLESRWFVVPGIVGLLTLVVTMLVTSLTVAREREEGTFEQLLVTPIRPVEILIGKALPGFLIGLFEASATVLVAILWFRVPFVGSFLALYAGIALFLVSAVGVGLMISSLSATLQQGLLGAFLFMVPAVILSGFTTPIENMPRVIQYVTYLDPLRYFMVVLRGTFLMGTPFRMLVGQYVPMLAIGAVSLAAAGWAFRHRRS